MSSLPSKGARTKETVEEFMQPNVLKTIKQDPHQILEELDRTFTWSLYLELCCRAMKGSEWVPYSFWFV